MSNLICQITLWCWNLRDRVWGSITLLFGRATITPAEEAFYDSLTDQEA